MLRILTCSCANVEELARNFLKVKCNRADWLSVPHTKGKDACLRYVKQELPCPADDLLEYIRSQGKFTIILGYALVGDGVWEYDWRDIGSGGNPATREDAAIIAQHF